MDHGVAHLSLIPCRLEGNDRSEMVNQLVFGDLYRVLESHDKWLRISTEYDKYEAWIDRKQHLAISQPQFEQLAKANLSYSVELVHSAISTKHHLPLVLGSTLSDFDGLNFTFLSDKWVFNGQAFDPKHNKVEPNLSVKLALKYINAPYLWGGKSPFGIDCSGLTQMVYRCLGCHLPRDAHQQVEKGTNIDFVEQAVNGDLAFFHNEDNKVTHVGIVYLDEKGNRSIIHASGKVRIDVLDNHGIYNKETKKYSHNLRLIKRVI